ncbi:MAG: EFR1 family ferrodoxin [Candidatus Omnitrophica bacterium]|nr:EFR1 family ferrodoxin [Candidatus Omnitrophota bacterium]
MSTVIYYFSATGNSLVIANDLAKELGDTDVVAMVEALDKPVDTVYDNVGIVFPVYISGLPLIVARFLKNLNISNNTYYFAVTNFGGMPGRALALTRKILKERGASLAAGFGILMPGNYTPLYGAAAKDKQKAIFDKEKVRIKEIAGKVREGATGILEEKLFSIGAILYALLYKKGSSEIPAADAGFWITDKCTSCGLCEKVCPVANIAMENGRPKWLHHCEQCMACLQWCPVEAIQYKQSTAGKEHYHHPDIKISDIIKQKQNDKLR